MDDEYASIVSFKDEILRSPAQAADTFPCEFQLHILTGNRGTKLLSGTVNRNNSPIDQMGQQPLTDNFYFRQFRHG
jgi:hypothetical protein